MQHGIVSAVLLTVLAALVGAPDEPAVAPTRVRSTDPPLARLLQDGYHRSVTFRRLVDRLERSDLLVYVQLRLDPSETALCCVINTAGGRYVRAYITRDRGANQMIALIAHELQHAVEIADRPEVVDASTFAAFFRDHGHEIPGGQGAAHYETKAAVRIGILVTNELLNPNP